jgi:DNA-binding transcriptional LysR family regulator
VIDKLEFLVAIARERNFRRAAEACGVAQPTLSAAIRALEDTLGVMLVRRSSRFQGLTPEGERVLAWAHRLVADARTMRDELQALRHGLSGHLVIASIPTALTFLPVLTRPFQARHAAVRITVQSKSSNEVMQDLDSFRADAGVTYTGNEAIGRLRVLPLYVERYRLVTTAAGPGHGKAALTWAEAGALPLCLLTDDMQNRRILNRLLDPGGAGAARCALESNSTVALLAQVQAGGCATIVPERLAETIAAAEPFRSVPITEPDAAFPVGLVLPDRSSLSPALSALVAMVERMQRTPKAIT